MLGPRNATMGFVQCDDEGTPVIKVWHSVEASTVHAQLAHASISRPRNVAL